MHKEFYLSLTHTGVQARSANFRQLLFSVKATWLWWVRAEVLLVPPSYVKGGKEGKKENIKAKIKKVLFLSILLPWDSINQGGLS